MDTAIEESARVSRRTFAARFVGAFWTFATLTIISQRTAHANHTPPPPGCYGYGVCHSCPSGSVQPSLGCPGGTGCWHWTDPVGCRTYRCCDYLEDGDPCLCRTVVCNCC